LSGGWRMKMGLARAILQAQMRVFLKLFSGDWQCWMHLWFFFNAIFWICHGDISCEL
jgi:hypothetical protein